MSMTTEEILTLQALKFKETHMHPVSPVLEAALEENGEKGPIPLRNICALISVPMFQNVEIYCQLLNMSKRKFVELALVDLLEKCNTVVDQVQPFPLEQE
jgi:hypothetical protein